MPLSETGVVAVIVALLGSGAWNAIGAWLKARREEPITRRDAELANTERTQAMTLALLEQVQEQYASERAARIALAAEVKEIRERHEAESRQITRLRAGLDALLAWGERLHANWDYLRQQSTPPPLPKIDLDQKEGNAW